MQKYYDHEFYSRSKPGMTSSAEIVLGLLFPSLKPQRVLDIGCGQGAWLAVAESLGAKEVTGYDGTWVDSSKLLPCDMTFHGIDFDREIPIIGQTFDLCISLEVAEHISEENAKAFVNMLCSASDVVLFGAAIEGQGGTNHINEQWQTYWQLLFESNDFECLDVIRPQIWSTPSVCWWYKQNTFLFVRKGTDRLDIEALNKLRSPIMDLVHPEHYLEKLSAINQPTLRDCLRTLKRYFSVGKKT